MKTKTSELTGAALNWAVATAEGYTDLDTWHTGSITTRQPNGLTVTHGYAYNWSQGGPIIEREQISVTSQTNGHDWAAKGAHNYSYGPTPLIAAMRCYVASKLGNEVEIPETLQ